MPMQRRSEGEPDAASSSGGEPRSFVHIHLLGGFRVERDGSPVADRAWQRRSGKALVKMLAATSEHRLHRDVLIDRLWPDAGSAAGGNSLHQALLAMRRVLDPPRSATRRESCVRLVGDMVVLVTDSVSIDVDTFETLATQGLRARGIGELTAAVDAYGGDLLPEDLYEDWADGRREALARLHIEALLALSDVLERQGTLFAAIERAEQALVVDPVREDAHRQLIRLFALSGRRDQALRQYQQCREVLAEELGVDPDPETVALHDAVLSGELTAAAANSGSDSVPLPAAVRRRALISIAGRERPLTVFGDKLMQLRAGSGGMLLVSGEAGVGKTRLVAEAAVVAGEADVLVLWGTSYAEEGQLPYGAIGEALDEYLDALPHQRRQALVSSYPDLARLLSSPGTNIPTANQSDGTRLQLFASIGRLLTEISSSRPVLLVLDDLHAADEVSVQLVHYLARMAQKHPWLLVVTYREEEVRPGDAFHGVVSACMRRGWADRIELLRLSRVDAGTMMRSLLQGEFEDELLEGLFSVSLGNALYLQELIHSMRASGQIDYAEGRWRSVPGLSAPVPSGAADLVTARAARLSADATRVASLAAVVGMECSPALLREASGLSEPALYERLEEIVTMHILEVQPTEDGREARYAFRHPLFRKALYAQISSPRRSHLHAIVGAAMEAVSPDFVDALAYHWARTANDEKATHFLERAGESAAARYAHEVAVIRYRDAMARIDGEREPERLARLQRRLGTVLTRIGVYDEALLLLDAARHYDELAGNLDELTRTMALCVRAHRQQGTADAGLALGLALLSTIRDGDRLSVSVDASVELYVALAGAARAVGRLEDTVRLAEQASELARAAGKDQALAMAESRRGDALGAMGRTEEGIRVLEDAKDLAERSGSLTTVAEIYTNAGAFYTVLGDSRRGQEYRALAAELCERLGYPAHQAFALSELATAQFEEGRWEEARRTASQVLDIHESIDISWYLPYALCILGDIAMNSGEREVARDYFSRAYHLASERNDPQALASAVRGLADIDLLDGSPEAARVRLSDYLARLETDTVDPIHIAPALADALIWLDRLPDAEDILSEGLRKRRLWDFEEDCSPDYWSARENSRQHGSSGTKAPRPCKRRSRWPRPAVQ